jgi:hypothetical protein
MLDTGNVTRANDSAPLWAYRLTHPHSKEPQGQ